MKQERCESETEAKVVEGRRYASNCWGILRRLYLRKMVDGKATTIKTSLLICEKCGMVYLDTPEKLVLTEVKDEILLKQMKRYEEKI